MNFPNCSTHQDRKCEIICLSSDCQSRFKLICTLCLNSSKCKRHNWKVVKEVVEEIIEILENQENQLTQSRIYRMKNTEEIQQVVQKLKQKIKKYSDKITKQLLQKGKGLVDSVKKVDKHQIIKDNLKQFRKSQNRSLINLNSILKKISEFIKDDENGNIYLQNSGLKKHNSDIEKVIESPLENFKQEIHNLQQNIQTLLLNNTTNINTQQNQKQKQQFKIQKQQLQIQIDTLLEQVKTIPVLKNRIESLSEKLKLKDSRLKQFQSKLEKNKINDNRAIQLNILMEKLEKEKSLKAERIQKLLLLRQAYVKIFQNHCQKCMKQTVKICKWGPGAGSQTDITNTSCETGTILNVSIVTLADELLFLGHHQKQGQNYIEIPLIKKRPQVILINPFINLNDNGFKFFFSQ